MIALALRDMELLTKRLPRHLKTLLMDNPFGGYGGHLYLAGGSIRSILGGEKVSDYDIFGSSLAVLKHGEEVIKRKLADQGVKSVATQNAVTITASGVTPVQFITKWVYNFPVDLLREFDFTVAKAILYYNKDAKWVGVADENFYSDLAGKRLVYSGTGGTPGGSILRMVKLLRRGYGIQVDSLAKLLVRVQSETGAYRESGQLREGENWEESYLHILREVDPPTSVSGRHVDRPTVAEMNDPGYKPLDLSFRGDE